MEFCNIKRMEIIFNYSKMNDQSFNFQKAYLELELKVT